MISPSQIFSRISNNKGNNNDDSKEKDKKQDETIKKVVDDVSEYLNKHENNFSKYKSELVETLSEMIKGIEEKVGSKIEDKINNLKGMNDEYLNLKIKNSVDEKVVVRKRSNAMCEDANILDDKDSKSIKVKEHINLKNTSSDLLKKKRKSYIPLAPDLAKKLKEKFELLTEDHLKKLYINDDIIFYKKGIIYHELTNDFYCKLVKK
jgi:hypothetical protein